MLASGSINTLRAKHSLLDATVSDCATQFISQSKEGKHACYHDPFLIPINEIPRDIEDFSQTCALDAILAGRKEF